MNKKELKEIVEVLWKQNELVDYGMGLEENLEVIERLNKIIKGRK